MSIYQTSIEKAKSSMEMCYNNFSSFLPAGESPHLFGSHHQSPFADNSRLFTAAPSASPSCPD